MSPLSGMNDVSNLWHTVGDKSLQSRWWSVDPVQCNGGIIPGVHIARWSELTASIQSRNYWVCNGATLVLAVIRETETEVS